MRAETEQPTPSSLAMAVAKGDIASVQRIIDTAASISLDEKINVINYARKWTEHNIAYRSEEENNPQGIAEWYDVTPITLAAMRGHDSIVELLLKQGADPTLKGCSLEDVLSELLNDESLTMVDLPHMHMNAFDAASQLTNKIRCCRRTRDLLMVVKPYWKKTVYSGSSAVRQKRDAFTNAPLNMQWILDAVKEVPKLHDYPLKAKNFNEDVIDPNFWLKRRIQDEKPDETSCRKEHNIDAWVEVGQSRRCFSCGELKPVQSYNKNEKKKGVEARCISCVATNPMALDCTMSICTECKTLTKLGYGESVCQSCSNRLAVASKNTSIKE